VNRIDISGKCTVNHTILEEDLVKQFEKFAKKRIVNRCGNWNSKKAEMLKSLKETIRSKII
jgi:hypothetical protein